MGSFNALVEPESRVALSNYLIRDKYGHLVRVDNTLVSQGKKLFVNGTLEFLDKTRMVVKLSSITSWWITLQDQTSKPAEYLLIMADSTPFLRAVSLTHLYLREIHGNKGQKMVKQVESWLAVLGKEAVALREGFFRPHAKAINW